MSPSYQNITTYIIRRGADIVDEVEEDLEGEQDDVDNWDFLVDYWNKDPVTAPGASKDAPPTAAPTVSAPTTGGPSQEFIQGSSGLAKEVCLSHHLELIAKNPQPSESTGGDVAASAEIAPEPEVDELNSFQVAPDDTVPA